MTDPWKISAEEPPLLGTAAEQLSFAVRYAILAPSSHNTQPWLFRIAGDTLELRADRTRALPVVDPEDRALVISCGAALFNLRTAIRHLGFDATVDLVPDSAEEDLLARVRIRSRRAATGDEEALFGSITRRRTNRLRFEDRPIPSTLLETLVGLAEEEGAWLLVLDTEKRRHNVVDLIAEGDRVQGADRRFRRELAAWVHPNRSRSRDGIPAYGFGFSDVMSYAVPTILRTFDWGNGQAARDRQLAEGSPVLCVLGTARDEPAEWLRAGQALEKVLLRAKAEDVWASFLNQPIEAPELRIRLRELLGNAGLPQLLFRMGFGPEVRPTPRRPVEAVIIEPPSPAE